MVFLAPLPYDAVGRKTSGPTLDTINKAELDLNIEELPINNMMAKREEIP
ncbi:MAG: hypothetical protein H7Z13_02995 [Ferruginibacter sp.]|nr:hypothetical protein [Ferruginibacter sp.]